MTKKRRDTVATPHRDGEKARQKVRVGSKGVKVAACAIVHCCSAYSATAIKRPLRVIDFICYTTGLRP